MQTNRWTVELAGWLVGSHMDGWVDRWDGRSADMKMGG